MTDKENYYSFVNSDAPHSRYDSTRFHRKSRCLQLRSNEVVGCTGTTDLASKWQSSSDFRVLHGERLMGVRLVCSYYGPSMPPARTRIRSLGGVNVVE